MTESTLKNPKLRFPEFDENWRKMRINQLTERVSIPVEVEPNESYTQIGVRSHGKGIFHKEPVVGKELGNKRVFWVKEDLFIVNIVFAWEQAVAKTTRDEIGMIASHRFPMFKPKADLLDLNFLLLSFLTRRGKSLLELASPGGAGRNKTLGQREFDRTKINLPYVEEQKQIATFLSAVDGKLRQLATKKILLLKYKKGVMQQIFDQKIRFKDDQSNDFPNWQPRRFDEVFSFLPTNSFSREDLNYDEGTVRNIHYGDIHTKFRPLFDVEKERVPFINRDIQLTGISDESYCEEGDLVFADASEDYADVGKCVEITSLNGQRVVAGLHTLLARPRDKCFAAGFAGYLMKSWASRRQIMREAQGTKVLGISAGRLSKIKMFVPSVPEQQKVASFISSLDERIEIVRQQIELTNAFKKALLHQMFV